MQNNSSEVMLKKSLDGHNQELLSLTKFIKITEYCIDKYMIDKFYISIKEDIPIYLDNTLIQWCGYCGSIPEQKRALLNLMKKYNIEYTKYSNDEYDEFIKSKVELHNYYPDPSSFNIKATCTNHILIMPNDFQLVLLRLPTSTGIVVAEHFVNLSNLVKIYWQYQAKFYCLKFEDELNKVCVMQHNIEYSKMQKIKQLELDLESKYRIGCVYFIYENGDLNYFKIGWCFNLQERLSGLQTGNRRKLEVYNYYFVQFAYDEEQRLHSLFKESRINGEWFQVSTKDVDAIINENKLN